MSRRNKTVAMITCSNLFLFFNEVKIFAQTCYLRSPQRAMTNYNYLTSYLTSYVTSYVTSYLTSYVTSYVTSYLTSYVTSYVTSYLTSYVTSYLTSYVTSYLTSYVTSYLTSYLMSKNLGYVCVDVANMAAPLAFNFRDELIEHYFKIGYNHAEILSCLLLLHDEELSLRQLKRILARRGLKRRQNVSDLTTVIVAIEQEQQGSGSIRHVNLSSHFGPTCTWTT